MLAWGNPQFRTSVDQPTRHLLRFALKKCQTWAEHFGITSLVSKKESGSAARGASGEHLWGKVRGAEPQALARTRGWELLSEAWTTCCACEGSTCLAGVPGFCLEGELTLKLLRCFEP